MIRISSAQNDIQPSQKCAKDDTANEILPKLSSLPKSFRKRRSFRNNQRRLPQQHRQQQHDQNHRPLHYSSRLESRNSRHKRPAPSSATDEYHSRHHSSTSSFFVSLPQSPTALHHQRYHYYDASDSSAVITQSSDSEMDMTEDDYVSYNHHHQRQIHSTASLYHFNDPPSKRTRTDGSYHRPLPTPSTTIEWWKQKTNTQTTPHPKENDSDDSCSEGMKSCYCHICKSGGSSSSKTTVSSSSCLPPISEERTGTNNPTTQKNSLLSYFRSTTSSSSTHPCIPRGTHPPSSFPSGHVGTPSITAKSKSSTQKTCRHCERYSCPTCTHTCERCGGEYCTFCSMVNYDRPEERTFCLECGDLVESEEQEREEEDVVMG